MLIPRSLTRTHCGQLLILLTLSLRVSAVDVTVDANGMASGPNLLGSATPIAIIGAATLDATAAGKLYTISGTTTNYNITLPPATIGNGAIIGFSVAPWAAANQRYTLVPTTGTIDGQSSLSLISNSYVELVAVGGNWIARVLKTPLVYLEAYSTAGQTVAPASTLIQYEQKTSDSNNAWSGTVFTAPVSGVYIVSYTYDRASGNNALVPATLKNGALYRNGIITPGNATWNAGDTFSLMLNAGDTISFQDRTYGTTRSATASKNRLSIARLRD